MTIPIVRSRDRALLINRISQFIARGVGAVCTLASVPLIIGPLGKEGFGLWSTVASVIALLLWTDMGIGNSLATKLAQPIGEGNIPLAREMFSAAFVMLCSVGMILVTIGTPLVLFFDWNKYLNITSQNNLDIKWSLGCLLFLFALALPLSLVDRLRAALQENYYSALFQIISSITTVILYAFCNIFKLDAAWYLIGLQGPLTFSYLINYLILLRQNPGLTPKVIWQLNEFWDMSKLAGMHFVIAICSSIFYNIDNVFLLKHSRISAVAELAAYTRISSLANVTCMVLINPLWGALGDAYSKGDKVWMRLNISKTLLQVCAIVIGFGVILSLGHDYIIKYWLKNEILGDQLVLISVLTWSSCAILNALGATVLNIMRDVAVQAQCAVLTFLILVPLKYYLAGNIELYLMVFISSLVYLLLTVFPIWRRAISNIRQL